MEIIAVVLLSLVLIWTILFFGNIFLEIIDERDKIFDFRIIERKYADSRVYYYVQFKKRSFFCPVFTVWENEQIFENYGEAKHFLDNQRLYHKQRQLAKKVVKRTNIID